MGSKITTGDSEWDWMKLEYKPEIKLDSTYMWSYSTFPSPKLFNFTRDSKIQVHLVAIQVHLVAVQVHLVALKFLSSQFQV